MPSNRLVSLMRKKKLKNQWRIYMNPHDYRTLVDAVRFDMDGERGDYCELAVRLGAESALRVSETMTVQFNDIRDSTHPRVKIPFLKLRNTKATSGDFEDGKFRSTILPKATHDWMQTVRDRYNRPVDEPLIDRSKRSIQKYIKQVGELAADRSGNEDFEKLSSHDLRAFAATRWLVRHDLNAEVVMEVGGWSDYSNLKPYLANPDDEVIAREFQAGGSLMGGYRPEGQQQAMPEPERDVEREQATIGALIDS